MAAWPTLYVAMDRGSGEAVVIAATATKARRLASEARGTLPEEFDVEEVPLGDAVKVLKVPKGPLPRSVPAPVRTAPADEPVAPARRGDPETATRAAAAARRLGDNRRTEILRWIVAEVGRHHHGGDAGPYESDRTVSAGGRLGVTESEVTRGFGGVPGGNSKRLGELVSGAWLYARGERPSVSTGTPQRVLWPTAGAIEWVAANPAPRPQHHGGLAAADGGEFVGVQAGPA